MSAWPRLEPVTRSYFALALSSEMECSIILQQQEREREDSKNLRIVARSSSSLSITKLFSAPLTSADGSTQNEPFRPYTTLVVEVTTDAAQLQRYTSVPAPTQVLRTSPNASTIFLSSSVHTISYLGSSTSSRIWHVTRVGTVVTESEIPNAWAPKSLDVERVQQATFLGCVGLVFVVTMIGIIGIGWLREARHLGRRRI
jgi:hypothetical protein